MREVVRITENLYKKDFLLADRDFNDRNFNIKDK